MIQQIKTTRKNNERGWGFYRIFAEVRKDYVKPVYLSNKYGTYYKT